jgi:hypothetical protein
MNAHHRSRKETKLDLPLSFSSRPSCGREKGWLVARFPDEAEVVSVRTESAARHIFSIPPVPRRARLMSNEDSVHYKQWQHTPKGLTEKHI